MNGFLSGMAITAAFVALSGANLFPSFSIMVAAYLVPMVLVAPLVVMTYTSKRNILGAERYLNGMLVWPILMGGYFFLWLVSAGPP